MCPLLRTWPANQACALNGNWSSELQQPGLVMFLIFLGIYTKEWNCQVICFNFLRSYQTISEVVALFYICASCVWGLYFLCILTNIIIVSILVGIKWYFIVVLICIFLRMLIIFSVLIGYMYKLWRNVYFAHFKLGLSLLLSCKHFFTYPDTSPLSTLGYFIY